MLLLSAGYAVAAQGQSAMETLKQADYIKTSDYAKFVSLLEQTEKMDSLTTREQDYLRYLRAWQHAYNSDYERAIPELTAISEKSGDMTVRFRAGITAVNVLVVSTKYTQAFSQLRNLVALLPRITDADARQQGLSVAAFLYNEVGEYELGASFADTVIEENWAGRGVCKGGQLKMEALSKSGKLDLDQSNIYQMIDSCVRIGEPLYANLIRTYLARSYIEARRFDEAIKLLNDFHAEVRATHYPRLLAEYDALLAEAYWQSGYPAKAHEYALQAVNHSANNQFSRPLVTANRLLYEAAKERGDAAAALRFHEKYAAADKGYLDDISARQIAYEKVKHETLSSRLQIDALNRQNEVLKLERENNRLYIALLISILGFIALWAYKTKRSQVHFMRLSQKDGLTGISNRPHFIDRAERILEVAEKAGQELCVVLCDLDYFKAINDRYGHAAGDQVLRQTVNICQSQLRPTDLFGRFGGEEFAIVLAGCELDVARQRCEQLRHSIASATMPELALHSNITASFGVASTKTSGYELRLLLAHADTALYQAKRAGRNCVVAYDPKRAVADFDEEAEKRILGVG
jgi:diguanylate cyclase (GGDEF)-like protein